MPTGTTPESGDVTAGGEDELEVGLAALNVDASVNQDGHVRPEEETSDAVQEDPIDGWTLPPREECPVCFLPLPILHPLSQYMLCCGKTICCGCEDEMERTCEATGRDDYPCPFCRAPAPESDEEIIARLEARTEKNDPKAMLELGYRHIRGLCGLPEDWRKGLDLTCRAADLGLPAANGTLGSFYAYGKYVEKDLEESCRFFKIAAEKGDYYARCDLGRVEEARGNVSAAIEHYQISASAGYQGAVDALKDGYKDGHISKEEFAASLRAFQAAKDEMKSEAREQARVSRNRA